MLNEYVTLLNYLQYFLGSKDCHLVTWSRDQTLRIWRVDPQLQKVRGVQVKKVYLC